MNILNFSNYIEEQKITAADWENMITVAFNGGPSKDKATPLKSIDAYNEAKPALRKITKALKDAGFSGKMKQTGSSQGKLNSNWLGTDTTPKADMVVGKNGLSLKKTGGSQLMSAKRSETLSTFYAAIDFMDADSDTEATKLARKLDKLMTEFVVPKKMGTIGDFLTRTKGNTRQRGAEKELANEYIEKTNLFKSMTEQIKSFFDDNQVFKNYFVYEAASGEYKFQPDRAAAAQYVVVFDADSGSTIIHRISRGYGKMGNYIPKLADTVKLRISWKTHSSKAQKTFPSLRADVRENSSKEDTFQSMFDRHFSEINEGLLSDIVNRVKSFFTKIISKVYQLAKSGIMAILRFFGILPESISVSPAMYT